jgi:hypothetical protein
MKEEKGRETRRKKVRREIGKTEGERESEGR